jgi:pyruvate,water dikinase
MSEGDTQNGSALPVPPNFPVTWEDEKEAALLWRWDDIHSPLPSSPMSVSVGDSQRPASAPAAPRQPEQRFRRKINGYSYSATIQEPQTPEQEEAQRIATEEMVSKTRHRWDDEFLPLLKRNLEHMRNVDLASATGAELVEHLDEFLEINAKHWHIHGQVVFPLTRAVESMATLYREIMGTVPDEEPYMLLQGMDNKSLETDRALQALAEEARARPDVARALAEESAAGASLDALAGVRQGSEFLGKLEEFLIVYGLRPTGFDYVFPCWREDPSFVVLNIKSYLKSPPRDLVRETADLAGESERMLLRVTEKLEADEPAREAFLRAYQLARELWPLKEDHSFYIDQGTAAMVRILIAEMGRRLAEDATLEAPDGVFYLTLDELKAATKGNPSAGLAETAAARREERQRFMGVIPPPFLGTMPPEGADGSASGFQRMHGPASPRPDDGATVLRGVPGSRGKATGIARVVRSPEEFGKVGPGDVLVCTSTSPTWTPLFGSVSALVSDSGGVLSHTAIVAREYRLPAVVGVKYGTSMISDGQVVTVDGDAGVVHLR